jgi:hypothetical protein
VEDFLRNVRIPALLLALVVIGCGRNDDQLDKVVQGYLQSEESASCQYLTAPQEKLCRRPHAG